jgi:Rrf2 family transcriptional regulator, cysteine metabolism repressor
MYIPRYDEVAILLMSELAASYGQGALSLASVSRNHGVSALFLKKIVRSLKSAGLVKSREGINGGYELAKSPEKISLWEIINSFSEKKSEQIFVNYKNCPIIQNCLPQLVHLTIKNAFINSFSDIMLSQIITSGSRQ